MLDSGSRKYTMGWLKECAISLRTIRDGNKKGSRYPVGPGERYDIVAPYTRSRAQLQQELLSERPSIWSVLFASASPHVKMKMVVLAILMTVMDVLFSYYSIQGIRTVLFDVTQPLYVGYAWSAVFSFSLLMRFGLVYLGEMLVLLPASYSPLFASGLLIAEKSLNIDVSADTMLFNVVTDDVLMLNNTFMFLFGHAPPRFLTGSVMLTLIILRDPIIGAIGVGLLSLLMLLSLALSVVSRNVILHRSHMRDLWVQKIFDFFITLKEMKFSALEGKYFLMSLDGFRNAAAYFARSSLIINVNRYIDYARLAFSAVIIPLTSVLRGQDADTLLAAFIDVNALILAFRYINMLPQRAIQASATTSRVAQVLFRNIEKEEHWFEDPIFITTATSIVLSASVEVPQTIHFAGRNTNDEEEDVSIELEDIGHTFKLQIPYMKADAGDKIAIQGASGSGKTTFLSALKDISRVEGRVCSMIGPGKIFNVSFRDNVIYGLPFNETKYKRVIWACDLEVDLSTMSGGDHFIVGTDGNRLSGGQKQRLTLARLLYRDREIYLLDCPFSALDAKVRQTVMQRVLGTTLKDAIVFLATQEKEVASWCHKSYFLNGGEFIENEDHQMISGAANTTHLEEERAFIVADEDEKQLGDELKGSIQSMSDGQVIGWYLNHLGFFAKLNWIGGISLHFALLLLADFWLSYWGSDEYQLTNEVYLGIYIGILGIEALFFWVHLYLFQFSAQNTSVDIFDRVWGRVSKSKFGPIALTEEKLLKRDAYQFHKFTVHIPELLWEVVNSVLGILMFLGFFIAIQWWLFPIIFLCCALVPVMPKIDKIMVQMQVREDTILIANLIDISSLECEDFSYFHENDYTHILWSQHVSHFENWASNEGARNGVQSTGIFLMQIPMIIILVGAPFAIISFFRGDSLAFILIVAFSQLMFQFPYILQSVFYLLAEKAVLPVIPTTIRYLDYPLETQPDAISADVAWPQTGTLSLKSISLKYPGAQSFALNDITFQLPGGSVVAVVGRTGAGKSSTVSVMEMLYDIDGEITLDGVNLRSVDRYQYRRRIAVMPQLENPMLPKSCVRDNVDFYGEYSDEEVTQAMVKCGCTQSLTTKTSNISTGELVFIQLARLILGKRKLIIVDEPTASLDSEQENKFMNLLVEELKDSTIIIVTHNLFPTLFCDLVLVYSRGCVAEQGSPEGLKTTPGSIFKELWEIHSAKNT